MTGPVLADLGTAAPEVTVVVPVHGDRGGLRRTLEHLSAQITERPFEVVVVDNGDNPGVGAVVAAHPRVRLLEEETPGSYPARNSGVQAARGRVIAFTDADCLPSPHWLAAGVAALEEHGDGVFVGGHIEVLVEGPRAPSAAELWQLGSDLRQEVYVTERGWAATANLFVRREDFARVGPFTTGLESGGDREWGERATALGVRGVFAAGARVDHPARPSLRQLHQKIRRVTRGAVARQRTEGVPVHPAGRLRAARPNVRSAWRSSARVAARYPERIRFVAIAIWIHYLRLGYGWWVSWSSRR